MFGKMLLWTITSPSGQKGQLTPVQNSNTGFLRVCPKMEKTSNKVKKITVTIFIVPP